MSLKELKSNTRLSGFMSLIVLMWMGLFVYLTLKYLVAKDFMNFVSSSFVAAILIYTFLRVVCLYFSNVMEIRRRELILSIKEARERWHFPS